MNCKSAKREIIFLIEEEIEESNKRNILEHIKKCEGCGKYFKEMTQFYGKLKREKEGFADSKIKIPDNLLTTLKIGLSDMDKQNLPEKRFSFGLLPALASVVIVILLGVFSIWYFKSGQYDYRNEINSETLRDITDYFYTDILILETGENGIFRTKFLIELENYFYDNIKYSNPMLEKEAIVELSTRESEKYFSYFTMTDYKS